MCLGVFAFLCVFRASFVSVWLGGKRINCHGSLKAFDMLLVLIKGTTVEQ